METRNERILIETERHRIVGAVLLPADGYRSRLSDFLNASERDFIAITDAVVETLGQANGPYRSDFVAVGREHIVLAMPEPPRAD